MKKKFFKWLKHILAEYEAAEKQRWKIKRERILNTPLVETTYIEIAGKKYRIITALRRGLLIDMIRSGSGISIPEPLWISRFAYSFGPNSLSPEQSVREALSLAGIRPLEPKEIEDISRLGPITHKDSSEEDIEVFVRVANVFIGERLWHFTKGIWVLSKTVFMSEYGTGTRIFMSA